MQQDRARRMAAAACLALAVAGCGSQELPEQRASTSEAAAVSEQAPPQQPADVEAIRADVVASYERWAGSPEDNQALNVLIAYYQNGAYDQCMNLAGYDEYRWEAGIAPVTWWPALGQTLWLHDPFVSDEIQSRIDDARVAQLERARNNPDESEAEQQQQLQCRKQADTQAVDSAPDVPGIDQLREDWAAALGEAISPIAGDSAAYAKCVVDTVSFPDGQRLDGSDYFAMVASRNEVFDGLAPSSSTVLAAWTPSGVHHRLTAEWDPLVEAVNAYQAAAWTCSEPVYANGIRALPPVLKKFESTHEGAIAMAEAFWARTLVKATELGYTPEDPYLTNHG